MRKSKCLTSASIEEDRNLPVTPQALLKVRTTALLGSQVDAIWYHSWEGMKLYYSNGAFAQIYGSVKPTGAGVTNCQSLIANFGKDALEVMIDRCKKEGVEIFYCNRMNDTHDSFSPITRPIKLEHPEYTLLSKEEGQKYGGSKYPDVRTLWAALNFEYDEVRQRTVDALREVCQSYDIDGIDLDFLRHPLYFPPTMQHRTVEERHIKLMNDMVRKIRAMTEEEGIRRGRAILVAARSEGDVALSRSIGLDVETWLKEGLIDVLITGSWLDYALPMKRIVGLAHRHGVPVYPMVNVSYQSPRYQDRTVWRGLARQRFGEGADGIYTFNTFEPTLWLWRELGDPKSMAGRDTTYVWDYLSTQRRASDVLAKARLTRFRWPLEITDETSEPIVLYVGENLSSPPPAGKQRSIKLRLHLSVNGWGLNEGHGLEVKLNGKPLEDPSFDPPLAEYPHYVWAEFQPDADLFRQGGNEVHVTVGMRNSGEVTVDQARLQVQYSDANGSE
jgi:hypothetical protein